MGFGLFLKITTFHCSECVDETLQQSNKNCAVTNIGGFLKNVSYDENRHEYFHKCAYSNITYSSTSTSLVCGGMKYFDLQNRVLQSQRNRVLRRVT